MYFFVARQPIFCADKSLYAYELLFRNSDRNEFPAIDANAATSRMVDGMTSLHDWDEVLQGHDGFINFTAEAVINELPLTLPHKRVVIELLETSEPTSELLDAVMNLARKGYRIALDDYNHSTEWEAFLPYVSLVKIESPLLDPLALTAISERLRSYRNLSLLAEKIETYEQFEQAKALGFSYFQGYFFCKPEMIKSRFIGYSSAALLEVMREVNKPDLSPEKVAHACQGDVRLSMKLLRYVNSVLFSPVSPVSSIKHAVSFLGKKELRRFVYLSLTTYASSSRHLEVVKVSLVRARFCEVWALTVYPSQQSDEAFLAGMLSVVDGIFDKPIKTILQDIGLSDHLFQVITEKAGKLGEVLQFLEYLERADWPAVTARQASLSLTDETTFELYRTAILWAEQRLKILSSDE